MIYVYFILGEVHVEAKKRWNAPCMLCKQMRIRSILEMKEMQ